LNVYAGSDTFAQIGEPEGAGNRRNVAFEKLWQEIIESQIPKVATSAMKDPNQILGDMRRYLEEKVDSMRQQKDEELEQYKKEIERAKRFESQKAGVAASVGASVGGDSKLVVKRKTVAAAATTGTGTAPM
jgi:TolA-binding protein